MNVPAHRACAAGLVLLFLVILKATYVPAPGTDIEHGQGAIERNELEHCVLAPDAWLIRVPAPADPDEWRRKLDDSVRRRYGRFIVEHPTDEELSRAASGSCVFQK